MIFLKPDLILEFGLFCLFVLLGLGFDLGNFFITRANRYGFTEK